jgi:CubicO group peptidase (beta-lactamase class C family)
MQTDLNQLYQTILLAPISVEAGLKPIIKIPDNIAHPHADYSKYGGADKWGDLTLNRPAGLSAEMSYDFWEQDARLAWAAAGMVSTAEDMARWAYELYSPKGRAISSESRSLLVNSFSGEVVQFGGAPQRYGFHSSQREYKLTDGSVFVTYGHPGGGGGGGSILYYSPDLDIAVSVLANSELGYQRGQCGDFRAGDTTSPLVCIARELFQEASKSR